MADKLTIKVDGLQQLGERMRLLNADVTSRIARAATAAGAKVVQREAIARAPVDTGTLKRNIIVKRLRPGAETDLSSEHIVTPRRGKVSQSQRERGQGDAFYAKFVEFGTVNAPAQPFLAPALESQRDAAIQAVANRIRQRLARVKP